MNPPEKKNASIYFWMLLVPLFWGGAFGAAKHVITEIPPITAAALRFGSAGFILLIIVLLRSGWNLEGLKKHWFGLFIMALTGIFLYNVFFFTALKFTSAINGSLIIAASPALLTLGAVLFFHEPWNKRMGMGLILSLLGVFLVMTRGSVQSILSLSFNAGDMLFLAALLSWVVHGLTGKVVMRDLSPLFTTTVTTITGSAFLAICAMTEDGWSSVYSMSAQSWSEMVYMTVFATVIAFFLWNKGIHLIGASKSGIYMNLVPINATWIAVLLYGSPVVWQQLFGMAMVIAGVYIVTMDNKAIKKKSGFVPPKHSMDRIFPPDRV